jgi:putative oxidoreductase
MDIYFMQRLFSTFPNAWPGFGLLILRVTAALPLLTDSVTFICGVTHSSVFIVQLAALATAGLLIAGFCTPIAAAIQILLEFSMAWYEPQSVNLHLVLGAMGVCLTMLGPGAWSVDARLFGRKRINLSED